MVQIMSRLLLALVPAVLMLAACGSASKVTDKKKVANTDPQDEEVEIGYGTATRKDVGFDVNKVKVDEVTVQSYTSIADYLRSRVPGIEVNPNGSIKIRGQQALMGPSEALVVVDEVICDNINTINPNHVHSVQVLKDGSASIYGSRGGNGVVLITTKMAYEAQQAKIEAKKAEKEARKAEKAAKKKK